jgi:hypothetical protein
MKIEIKAKELVEQFRMDNTSEGESKAFKCALICIDEIINTCALDEDYKGWDRLNSTHRKYWDELYKEVEKMNDNEM